MSEFRPHVGTVPKRSAAVRRRFWPWSIAGALGLATAAWLLAPDAARDADDDRPLAATRAGSGGASATRSPIADLPPPAPYEPDPAGRAVLDALTLAPAPARSGGTGYVVTKADAELLAHTPLREGDVLLELDGQKLDPARLERLGAELGGYDDVWVSFERDGKKLETLLELRRR
jgi:hypothetical protein